MQQVFVVDKDKQPLMPCQPARARQLLRSGQAAVYRREISRLAHRTDQCADQRVVCHRGWVYRLLAAL
jgi:hypothetical protein